MDFRIYTEQEIAKAKESPSFEREYNLKYLGMIGNVFYTKDIDIAIQKGDNYNPSTGRIGDMQSITDDILTTTKCSQKHMA